MSTETVKGIPRNDKASIDEIERLKKLITRVELEGRAKQFVEEHKPNPAPRAEITNLEDTSKTLNQTKKELGAKVVTQQFSVGNLFDGGIANVEITREPIKCDNPVQWLMWLMPEITPARWQFEELMRMCGYLTHGNYKPSDKVEITPQNPYLFNGWMANGSGKDLILIAAFATWFPVIKARNRVIVTSSSQDQIKYQTEVHIRDLCNRANKKFGQIFKSVQFHHIVPELGSEIKLYVTDEPGRAEGYHPFPGGDMALILNECKSINEDINKATERCTGYSHRIEISSPGGKSGFLYNNAKADSTVHFPAPAILGRYYHRRVTAFDCPWIPASHIARVIEKYGEHDPWVQSSVFANASELDSPVVITEFEYDQCLAAKPEPIGDDIGIGLDIAAGGDEDACFVRKGNTVIHKFFFRQTDVILASELINLQLSPWKDIHYTFRADNGGVGVGCIDNLVRLGWRVVRTNNQSPAFDKNRFLNLGAEQWFHTKRLINRRAINIPDSTDKLKRQLTTRFWRGLDSTQGKLALESKIEAKLAGRPSPDRADAFVLCFASYYPKTEKYVEPVKKNLLNVYQFLRGVSNGTIRPANEASQNSRHYSLMSGKY